MFTNSKFNGDIVTWTLFAIREHTDMFLHSPLEHNLPKWYKVLKEKESRHNSKWYNLFRKAL